MSINKGLFTSTTDEWGTPQDFFDRMNHYFTLDLDVCAYPSNAKCARYFTPEQDGLKQEWKGRVWMNPPYGREIGKWVQKAYREVECGNAEIAVCLLPARTCSAWWHEYCMKGEVYFVRNRLRFGGSTSNAPFPNAVVVFSKCVSTEGYRTIDRHGNLIELRVV